MQITNDQRKQIVLILKRYPVTAAYLFGSQAKGITGPLSDVDIGLLFPSAMSKNERQTTSTKIFVDLEPIVRNDHIDLIDLVHAPVLLRYNAVVKGQLLFTKNKALSDNFRFETVQLFEDFQYHLDTRRRLMKQKFAV